jgi:hypothetical protein
MSQNQNTAEVLEAAEAELSAATAALLFPRSTAKLAQNARVQADVQQYRSTRTMSARFAAER